MIKNKIVRDTVLLTAMQLFLDTSALLLNVFITRSLGTSAMGVLTLTGSFLGLAGMLSNGNAFLCTSRLVSEELGKPAGSPGGVLAHGIKLCLLLSTAVSAAVIVFAEPISRRFFSGGEMARWIKVLPLSLIAGAVSACFKGYFNACRRAGISAAGDICEFIVRSAVIVSATLAADSSSEGTVCGIMIGSIVAGNIFSLGFCLIAYTRTRIKGTGSCTLNFRRYAAFAFPIMGGSVLTAVLSSTNDALIPICLRQNGDSAAEALSRFGVFEAIVIPTIFFPSVVLCSLSGIVVSESARAAAAGDSRRIKSLTERLTGRTFEYAVFAAAVLMRFGRPIGELLGGGELAGKMITVIAPVVPFIYMEIILESLIKGTGRQAFSSLNYLAEYIIRISAVLIFVPHLGFYGIVVSYYASNAAGNISRYIFLMRKTGMSFRPIRQFGAPAAYVFMTMCAAELPFRLTGTGPSGLPSMAAFTVIWMCLYAAVIMLLGSIRAIIPSGRPKFVQIAQK